MLVPDIKSLQSQEETTIITIDDMDSMVNLSSFNLPASDKEIKAFVKKVEKIIRGSFEYTEYIGFLKKELNFTKCHFFKNIDSSEFRKVKIEFHHYPFTLFDVVKTVVTKYIEDERVVRLNPFLIAEEVMKLHYKNIISLVPLSQTEHKMAHNGKLFINLRDALGCYESFIAKYEKFIDPEVKNNLENLKTLSKEDDKGEIPYSKLNKNFIKIEMSGVEKPKKIQIETDNIA